MSFTLGSRRNRSKQSSTSNSEAEISFGFSDGFGLNGRSILRSSAITEGLVWLIQNVEELDVIPFTQ